MSYSTVYIVTCSWINDICTHTLKVGQPSVHHSTWMSVVCIYINVQSRFTTSTLVWLRWISLNALSVGNYIKCTCGLRGVWSVYVPYSVVVIVWLASLFWLSLQGPSLCRQRVSKVSSARVVHMVGHRFCAQVCMYQPRMCVCWKLCS